VGGGAGAALIVSDHADGNELTRPGPSGDLVPGDAGEAPPGDASSVVAAWSPEWRASLPVRTSAEQAQLDHQVASAVRELQEAARRGGTRGYALHRRGLLEHAPARFIVEATLPEPLVLGPFVPGSEWPAVVRFSSAFPLERPDAEPDQRGLAVRLEHGGQRLDFLATTGEAHHARDAEAMIASLHAAAAAARGGLLGRLAALGVLLRSIGLSDALRLAKTVSAAAQAGVSLAGLTYYSRAPFQLGAHAVRYRFRPRGVSDMAPRASGDNALTHDLVQRLRTGVVAWDFQLQGFLDPVRTPMDDHRVAWRSPWLTVARLELSGGEQMSSAANAAVMEAPKPAGRAPTGYSATPAWPDARGAVFEPLGDLNALRATAYAVSQAGRLGTKA